MVESYVHGYRDRERDRLHDQADTLVELLHRDTVFPPGNSVLEIGCGLGAQTVTLAANSPRARITAVDVPTASLAAAARRVEYKHTTIKQYHKQGRALRTETTINRPADFEIGKRLTNLPALREIGI